MTAESILHEVPGGKALLEWFGRVPRFHDAELLDIVLTSKGPSTLRLHTWEMTDRVDAKGYYVLNKHVVVTVTLELVTHVDLANFNEPGIIFDLAMTRVGDEYQLGWGASYGVGGVVRARRIRFDLTPGKPS